MPFTAGILFAVRLGELIEAVFRMRHIAAGWADTLHLSLDLIPRSVIDVIVSTRVPKVLSGVITGFAGLIDRQVRIVFLDIISRYGEKYAIDIDAKDIESLHEIVCRLG